MRFGFVIALAVLPHLTDLTVFAVCGVAPGPQPSLGDQLRTAPIVFVGTVLFTWDNDRSARVKVESIWNGPDLPTYVDVRGEAPGSGAFSASESDHRYTSGLRYLFVPMNQGSPFQDFGECNVLSQPYSTELAAYAPAGARAPHPPTRLEDAQNFADQYRSLAEFAALIVVAVGFWVFLRSRRRSVT